MKADWERLRLKACSDDFTADPKGNFLHQNELEEKIGVNVNERQFLSKESSDAQTSYVCVARRHSSLILPRTSWILVTEIPRNLNWNRVKEFLWTSAKISSRHCPRTSPETGTLSPAVAAHLRGMRPTLTAKKDPLMLRRNSNILLLLYNFRYNSTMYFNCCAHIRIRIYTYP